MGSQRLRSFQALGSHARGMRLKLATMKDGLSISHIIRDYPLG